MDYITKSKCFPEHKVCQEKTRKVLNNSYKREEKKTTNKRKKQLAIVHCCEWIQAPSNYNPL